MACEDLKAKLAQEKEARAFIIEDLHNVKDPRERSQLLQELKQIGATIAATQIALNNCLTPPPVASLAPQSILKIQMTNPAPPNQTNPDWAKNIAGGTFPTSSGIEWKQVLDVQNEYDEFSLVGASGWVIHPEISGGDFPFSHPFGVDYECTIALDSQYNFLLAPGNENTSSTGSYASEIKQAQTLPKSAAVDKNITFNGVLPMEWDQNLVPESFRDNVHEGDRVAIYGRWIVDCGHDDFHTEIHPPLLMACGSLQKHTDNSQFTRVLLTSRPYLVSQKYTVDTDKIYDDSAADDGTFYTHILKEVIKVNAHASLLVEAHPKIKSFPFKGVNLLHMIVSAPPINDVNPIHVNRQLVVSYRFKIRSGCAVQVVQNDAQSFGVFIVLNSAGYTPPPLPHRNGVRISKDQIDKLSTDAGTKYLEAEAISTAVQLIFGGVIGAVIVDLILNRGVETDQYDPLKENNILDRTSAVIDAPANNIPRNSGIITDNSQPFPISGWIEARWIEKPIVVK
ncbi:MAG: hypothetical protein M3139_02680 [Bacteroidota bacterium]|nr:hypothetical protein [Bacteroidota bacterium]